VLGASRRIRGRKGRGCKGGGYGNRGSGIHSPFISTHGFNRAEQASLAISAEHSGYIRLKPSLNASNKTISECTDQGIPCARRADLQRKWLGGGL
jgi:hypothetical protein